MPAKEAQEVEEIAEAMTQRKLLRVEEVVELAVQLLARLQALHAKGTSLGKIGTARSRALKPGPRDDVYCTGVVLFHALALQEPKSPAPPLRSVRRDLPEWLGTVVDKALSPKPDGRYASAQEMSAALEAGRAAPAMDLDWEEHEDRTVGIVSPLDEVPAAAEGEAAPPPVAPEVAERRPSSMPPPAAVPQVKWRSKRRDRVADLLAIPVVLAVAGIFVGFALPAPGRPVWLFGAYGLLAGAVVAGILFVVRTRARSRG